MGGIRLAKSAVEFNFDSATTALVVKFSVASAPKDQNFMNLLTVAPRNWEFDADMFDVEGVNYPNTGSPCEPELSRYLHIKEVHH